MADAFIQAANNVIGLNPRPANLIINGDCVLTNGKEGEYKKFFRFYINHSIMAVFIKPDLLFSKTFKMKLQNSGLAKMPLTLPPINRRVFTKGSLVLGGTAIVGPHSLVAAKSETVKLDPNRVALFSDTHISADPTQSYPGTKWPGSPVKDGDHEWVNMADAFTQAAKNVIALNPRPANLIINGDCALSNGKEGEYKELLRLIEPLRLAGITVHVTIGNHDNRERLWKLLPFLKKEQMGIHAEVVELPHANLILLDSKTRSLGGNQLVWLVKQLDKRKDKPALIFSHYNPYPNRGVRPIPGLRDGKALLNILAKCKHARAYLYGHTHEWQYDQRDHLHLINQPAVAYYFGKGHAHAWLDMKLTEKSADLKLKCINAQHKQHGDHRQIILKDA